MPVLVFKLLPLLISCGLLVYAFRVHERFWSLGFSGWKKMYLGLAAIFLGSLGGVFFEFAELRTWQLSTGWPVDWAFFGLFAAIGAWLLLWGSVERLTVAAREKETLDERKEAFELFDSIRDAAQGPYSFLEILNFSLKEIIRKIGADAGGIWLLHPSGKDYILASASGFPLPLQQKLERVPSVHAGFNRVVEGGTAREVYNPESLQDWFPELYGGMGRYGSLIGVPFFGGMGANNRRETLGLLLVCSRGRASLGPGDIKLIGSAVAFLASTIAEVKTARLMRNQKSAFERLRAREGELAEWMNTWSTSGGPHQRLQAAVVALAERVENFVGCGRYVSEGDRWESLALAGGNDLMGDPEFRRAAGEAVRLGAPVEFCATGKVIDGQQTVGYRLIPCNNLQIPGSSTAVLFIPQIPEKPWWYESAIEMLRELTLVVLAVDQAQNRRVTLPINQRKLQPEYDWAKLGRLMNRGLRKKPDELPVLLAELLPPGTRIAVWQSVPGGEDSFHLRLAAGPDVGSSYCPTEGLADAPAADALEYNAYLGGIVRFTYVAATPLSGLWDDFGGGWRGTRVPATHLPKQWGWITFYRKVDAPEIGDDAQNYLQCLAGMAEIILARHDRPASGIVSFNGSDTGHRISADRSLEDAGDNGDRKASLLETDPDSIPHGRISLDRAVAQWIVGQTQRVRLGSFAFDSSPTSTPVMPAQIISDILSWGADHLKNGLPEEGYLTISARGEGGRISIIFERSNIPPEESEHISDHPAMIAPVNERIRVTLDSWNARVRVINSPSGPRKLILSFAVVDEGKEDMASGARVLVVDEQEFLRDLLLGMLEILGCRANASASVKEGLRLYNPGDFDIVISGNALPDMAAQEFARQIKDQNPRIRFIVVQERGYSEPTDSGSEWIDHVLLKPFRIEDVRQALTGLPAGTIS